ncbi:hypothetical protein AB0L00_33465 [Actinoallomurus sp. NPDC052308]|uniref:hypothetical protein n=1 Tax=Actinoallomurus sp. NPDC052308 TaxID=3155530 RepID=UPI0034224262
MTAAVAGWAYLADELVDYDVLRAALVEIAGSALLSMVCDGCFAEVIGVHRSTLRRADRLGDRERAATRVVDDLRRRFASSSSNRCIFDSIN